MPKRTNPFQQLVYLIQLQLKERPDMVVTESKMLINRVNGTTARETDIVVEGNQGGVPFILAFECTGRSRKPDIEWVEQMWAKHENLSDKLVLVANRPFTKEAIKYAREKGIEAVELSAATKMDWPAQIDRYTDMIFATFDFHVRLPDSVVEYDVPAGGIHFSGDEMVILTDHLGKSAPVVEAFEAIVRNYSDFAKKVMDKYYELPKEQRRTEHTATYEYVPSESMTLSQGTLSYLLKRIKLVVGVKVGEAPLSMQRVGFRNINVAHGHAEMAAGGLAGQTVRFVVTEKQGEMPKAALQVSGTNGTNRAEIQIAELNPNGPVPMRKQTT